MIDIVDRTVTIANVDQRLKNGKDVFLVENATALRGIPTDPTIELHPSDGRQIVAVGIEEQVLEQILGRLLCRRLARTHHAINLDQRLETRCRRVDIQCVRDERPTIEVVDIQRADIIDSRSDQ